MSKTVVLKLDEGHAYALTGMINLSSALILGDAELFVECLVSLKKDVEEGRVTKEQVNHLVDEVTKIADFYLGGM